MVHSLGVGHADSADPTCAFILTTDTTAVATYTYLAKGDVDRTFANPIDFWDFMKFIAAYGSAAGEPNYIRAWDMANGTGQEAVDGQIGFADFMKFIDLYSTNPYPHRATP